jgi:peptidoglycan hydrolase-like protein with peptidoglycan-binding domain
VISGYNAYPIDGVQGTKTQAAITKFINDRKLAADAASGANFFDVLVEAARNPEGVGFSRCNDTTR